MYYASLNWGSISLNEKIPNNIAVQAGKDKISENLHNIVNTGWIVHNLWKQDGLYFFLKWIVYQLQKQLHFIPQDITVKNIFSKM